MARKIVLSLTLFLGFVAMANAQTYSHCFHPSPVFDPVTGKTICACRLHVGAGDCLCSQVGGACKTSGNCQYDCLSGATPENLARVRSGVNASPKTVTVFMTQKCYDANSKMWTDEAVKQSKPIRFVVVPEQMTAEQVADWNKRIEAVERAIVQQELQ